jgi:hypothetical protein
MIAPYFETMLRPNAWETHTNEWAPDRSWEVTWKPYHSPTDDIDLDLQDTYAARPSMDWPPGSPPAAYAHAYVRSGQCDVLLDFQATCPARVWLNGRDVSTLERLVSGVPASAGYHPGEGDSPYRRPVTLATGVNRVLVKLFFPQKDYGTGLSRPTRFRLRFLGVDGMPISLAGCSLNNPELYEADLRRRDRVTAPEAGSCLADLTRVSLKSKRFRYVFYTDEAATLDAEVRLLTAAERAKQFKRDETSFDDQAFAARLTANLLDYEGNVVGRQAADLSYGLQAAGCTWDFGRLAKGHYTLYSWLHLDGKLLKSVSPVMFAVVDRPHPLPKGVTSKFAHSYYYLGVAEPEFIEVLAAAGVRMNIGSMHWWWLNEDPIEWSKKPVEQREWAYTPLPEVLTLARKWGVEMTGDLGGCFPPGFKKSYYKDYQIPEDAKGKLVVINPYWPTYANDSPEFAKLVDEYVMPTVSRYKSHFRYWKLQNELNSWINDGATPEWWGPVLKVIYQSLKKADPEAILVHASMSGTGLSFLEPLFQQGYDKYFDVLDYHVYQWPFYDPVDDLGGLKDLLALMDKYGVDKPIQDGEFGAYRSLWEDGSRAQAGAWARYLVVAHTYDRLQRVGAHFHDGGGWTAGSEYGQFPAYVAFRTCADNLEGATKHEKLDLGPGIAAYRFQQGGGRVTAVWTRDGQAKSVVVSVRRARVRVIDILGRECAVQAKHGQASVAVTGDPLYIRD